MNEQSIFIDAMQLAGSDLDEYLTDQCKGDEVLRKRVESLLALQDKASEFLSDPAVKLDDTHHDSGEFESEGTCIGPYKLLEPIGEGGMGTVYMAEQTEPVRRRVALKLIKTGMDTKQVIARFDAERQALAMMDHANIAKVLDAGATDAGRPYFVMELVKGTSITKFCDEQRLDTEARLKLFQQVCHAVQHAHQKGVIHRDLKPANIMVAMYDDQPVPKVIDFGVAKATGEQLTEKTMFTRFGQVIGTLPYMSPEQAQFNQKDIDTRSDIYSLGAVLYELLSGQPPFDQAQLKSQALDETLRMIREDEPTKPSTKLNGAVQAVQIASNRKSSTEKLGSILRGDLDWIVMKAIEKDRSRRYSTASEFASDIHRYLENEPVHAGSPTAAYRFKKFAKRNRGKLVIGSAVLSSLLIACAALAYSTINGRNQQNITQNALATSELEKARLEGLSNFIITGLIDAATPNGIGNPEITVHDAILALEEKIDDSMPNSPAVRAWVLGQLGQYISNLGRFKESRRVLALAHEQMLEIGSETDTAALDVGRELAWTLSHLGRHEEAITLARQVAESATQEYGDVGAVKSCWHTLGATLEQAGQLDESELAYRRSIEIGDRIGSNNAGAIGQLGDIYRERNDFNKAEEMYLEALRLRREAQGEYHIETMRVLDDLGLLYIEKSEPAKAKEILGNLLEKKRSVVGEQHRSYLDTLNALARTDYELGDYEGSLERIEQAVEITTQLLGELNQLTLTYKNNRILILRDLRRWNDAKTSCEELIASRETLRKTNPKDMGNVQMLGVANWQLGMVHSFDQEHDAAINYYDKAVRLLEKQLETEFSGLGSQEDLSGTLQWRSTSLRHVHRFEESIADAERARTLIDSPLDEQLDCDLRRAQVLAEMGKHDEAVNITESVMDELGTKASLVAHAASVYAISLKTIEPNASSESLFLKRTLELLQQAADLGEFDHPFRHIALRENPDFESLQENEKFKAFLDQITPQQKTN